jgi:hypothetical protein
VRDEIAGIKAVLAAGEVRKMKARVNARLADNAARGVAPGSLPFGYAHGLKGKDKTYVIVAEQAAAIRWAAEKVLAGLSLSSVAAALRDGTWTAPGPPAPLTGRHRVKLRDGDGAVITDEEGNPVTRASQLRAGSVRNMITMPSVAGKRVVRGVIVGDGNWPAILDENTWQACRAKLSAPRVVDRSNGGIYAVSPAHSGYSGRKYMLTGGLARCGVCGGALSGSKKQLKGGAARGGRDVAYLLCRAKDEDGKVRGCTGIMLEATEQHVLDRLWAELDKPEFLDRLTVDEHAGRRDEITTTLEALDGRRAELGMLWGAGQLGSSEWAAARQALDGTERALRAELNAKPAPPVRVDIAEARSAWSSLDLGERREFVRVYVDRVTIGPAKPGTKGFDPGRVDVHFRELASML